MSPIADRDRKRNDPKRKRIRAAGPIRRVRQEDLPGIQPTLVREFDHRIAQTRLEHEPLPDTFLRSEAGDRFGGPSRLGQRFYVQSRQGLSRWGLANRR